MDFTQSSLPTLTPPRAEVQDECLTHLGRERIDPFYYMRDKEDPRVLEYLSSIGIICTEVFKHTRVFFIPYVVEGINTFAPQMGQAFVLDFSTWRGKCRQG